MKRLSAPLVAIVLCCALPVELRAQAVQNIVLRNSFSPLGAGARGVGMGGAFIAVADDGTAATFNPCAPQKVDPALIARCD